MDTTASNHQDNLLELERRLEEIHEWLGTIKDPTFMGIKMRVAKHLMQDLNYIHTMTGNASLLASISSGTHTDKQDLTAGPKIIMGKTIDTHKPVRQEDLKPSKNEKAKFTANVSDLYSAFLDLKDSDVLAIIGKPGGVALLKGVAKKAFVTGWETIDDSDIDTSFFADIREGIRANIKSEKLNESVESKLNSENVELNSDEDGEEEVAPVAKKSAPKPVAKKSATKKSTPDADDYE